MAWSRLVVVVAVWWSFSSCDGNTDIDVRLEGSGAGRVTSKTIIGPSWDKVAIDCPGDCSEHSNWKSKYVMTATPAAGSRFAGWDDDGEGECRSLGTCELYTGTKDTYVLTARFELESTVDLTVSRTGSGDGRVRSLEASTIDCGTTCSGAFVVGTSVTLEATAATGSKFVGWSGACSGTSATCVVSMDMTKAVSAAFVPADVELTIGRLGLGSGTVTSSPSGISCGSSCSAGFAPGTTVTLSAVADTNSTFLGWSDGCSGTGACTVTLSTAVNVNARFELQQRTLTITRAGTGGGTVNSFPAGVDCGSTCAADFAIGSVVNLTATADATSTFAGWSGGGCSGTGPCSVTLADAVTVTATFTRHRYALSVSLAGTGAGRVTSSPTAIDCGSSCSADFDSGTTVTLTAAPDAGSTFAGWSGACAGTGTCSVTVTAITSVSATFTRNVYDLTVSRSGTGAGVITSSPAGLSCGASCTAPFASGTAVTLIATPDATSTFTGWSGGCSGTGACVVTVSAATSVSATFTRNRYTLSVAKSGSGNGTVTSAPSGIGCGASCATDFDAGTVVTLTATPDGASSFAGWSGACTGSGACVVTMSAAANVTATFSATPFALTVIRAGTGGGTVSSSPAGITCGTSCSSTFPASTVVTLNAAADATSTFTGWSGAGCSGTGSCTVTISAALTVTATFTRHQHALIVSRAGAGSGTVTSSPAGIGCGSSCSASFDAGSTVTLTAVASSGSTFGGWSGGGCSGTGACVVTLLAATTVTATFALNSYPLAVTKFGTGGGAVTSSPAGISCGPTCVANFAHGTAVTLTASADAMSDFSGWSGACVGTGPCTVTLTAASSVSATFTRRRYALTVAKSGAGSGTVTSSPSGISCGATCSVTFDAGSSITLTAAADSASQFAGWSGGGCSGTGSCVVSLTAATTVTANFLPTEVLSASTTGAGTITSEPVGLACGSTCVARFVTGTVITLTATPNAGNTFVGWTGACSGTGACVVTLDSAKSVGALFAPITWALHVTKIGLGRVTSNPAGIDCGGFCSFSFTPQTVVLTATPSPDFTFAGWSGDCSGTGTCTLSMNAVRNVTANFTRPNIAFVTSATTTGAMGGLVGADGICQSAAAAASLPGTYRAWLSTTTGKASVRLGAGGWVRTDGLPFTNSVAELTAGTIYYPLRLDEFGNDVFTTTVFTSTTTIGTRQLDADTCADWTSNAGQTPAGLGTTGTATSAWTTGAYGSCGSNRRLYCFGVSETGASIISPPPPAARLAFVTSGTWTPGGGLPSADALCTSEAASAGLPGTFLALLTPLNTTAASRFSAAGAPWFRVDGVQLTATPTQLFTDAYWSAPLNVTAVGAYVHDFVWSGAPALTMQGAPGNTCVGWNSASPQNFGGTGAATDSQVANAFGGNSDLCAAAHRLSCLQQ